MLEVVLPWLIAGLGVAIAVAALIPMAAARGRLSVAESQIAGVRGDYENQIAKLQADLSGQRTLLQDAIDSSFKRHGEATEARTRLEEASRQLGVVTLERDIAIRDRDDAQKARAIAENHAVKSISEIEARSQREISAAKAAAQQAAADAERQVALARQSIAEAEKRMADWETAKSESLTAANAAALSAVTHVSSKLLDDHRRETEAAKQEAESRIRQNTEGLVRQVETMTGTLAALSQQVSDNRATVQTVVRALSSPGGAGQTAEIGLENTLKSFGLERDRDFLMQPSTFDEHGGGRLRPDALVFLPGDSVLVIDCKASQFLYEIARAESEGQGAEEDAYVRLAQTMTRHLRSLADKEYGNAVLEAWRRSGRPGEITRVINVMYVPNDAALERIGRADPQFSRRAVDRQIIPVGPAGLACIVGFARLEIERGLQIENHQRIVDATQRLLDGLIIALEHAAGIGKGIKSAADKFAAFSGSINHTLLTRVRTLSKLGVRPQRKSIPPPLPTYHVVGDDVHLTLEGDSDPPTQVEYLVPEEPDEERERK